MKRAILCAATLLLASGAWGQTAKPKMSTYHIEIIWKGTPMCCVTVQEPPRDGFETEYALADATSATVWTDAEWKACDVYAPREIWPLAQNKPLLSQQQHDDEIRRQQCEADGGTWGNAAQTGKPDKYGFVSVERSLGPCMMPKQEKEATPMDWSDILSDGEVVTGCLWQTYSDGPSICEPLPAKKVPPPFDVPPKEWDGPDTHPKDTCPPISAQMPNQLVGCALDYVPIPTHHRTCANPKRVLLMSEDKVWHCYDLGRMEQH